MTDITISTHLFSAADAIPNSLSEQCLALWNEAIGDDFSLSMRALTWLRQATNDETSVLLVASRHEQAVGFLQASYTMPCDIITLDGIAVVPQFQRQGVGRNLFSALQSTALVCQHQISNRHQAIQVGGGSFSLLAGVPERDDLFHFFARLGFLPGQHTIERAFVDVASYQTPNSLGELPAVVHPAQPSQQPQILNFLAQQKVTDERLLRFVQQGRRLSDLMLLWSENGLDGICLVGFEDSPLPIELAFPYRLPRPWAQISTLLVCVEPDEGLVNSRCAVLLDAALRRLHNNGINSAILTCALPLILQGQFPLQPYQRFQSFVL